MTTRLEQINEILTTGATAPVVTPPAGEPGREAVALIDKLDHYLTVADQYARAERKTDVPQLPTIMEYQIGHLMGVANELRTALARTQNARDGGEPSKFKANFDRPQYPTGETP